MESWKGMADPPKRRRSTAKGYNPINPAITPSSPKSDLLFTGPTETYAEKDDRHYFLEGLYGKQDEGLPRDKRVRRESIQSKEAQEGEEVLNGETQRSPRRKRFEKDQR